MDSIGLSRWTGQFLEARREASFQEFAWPRFSRHLRLIAMIAGTVHLLALSLDWKGAGDGKAFLALAALRLGTAFLFGAIALGSHPSGSRERVHGLLYVAMLGLVATRLGANHLAPLSPQPGVPAAIVALPLLPFIIFALFGIPTRLALLWCGLGSLLFLRDQVVLWGLASPATRVVILNLLLSNGVGYAFRLTLNRMMRRDFVLLRELEHEVAERQRAEREARTANEAKGRFLAVMSHEIRTPLNGVLGGAQLLQATALQEDQRRPLEILTRSGYQLATLLDDVLDLARIDAGRLELKVAPFSPEELLETARAVLQPQASAKGLGLRLETSPDLPGNLMGDALRLRQILLNLAGNAVKFTECGEVVVSLSCAGEEGGSGNRRCTFGVRDTGPGLDAAMQARIFLPFEQGDRQTHQRHGGTGLGLSICQDLVTAMGGELEVQSAPGQGSLFSFTLDLPLAMEGKAPGVVHGVAPGVPCPLRVLVVDDLEANRVVAHGLLATLGHESRGAAGGDEALEWLRAEIFDAVLLDLHMKDMDGMEVFRRMRSLPEGCPPVFLLTADTERGRMEVMLAQGVNGLLAKPLRKIRLAALLSGISPREERRATDPLLDAAHISRTLADLGPEVWKAGVEACGRSIQASLKELEDPALVPGALHRLAGVSATYGLVRLHRQVSHAESQAPLGNPASLGELRDLAQRSQERLEASLPS